jgi:F-type H+-transporting ATPase subunit delta
MKISTKQYARSLYEATKDKPRSEIDLLLANFVKILSRDNALERKNEIMLGFQKISDQENGIVEAEISTREELNEEVRTEVRTWVRTKYAAKEVVLKEKTDANAKGGIRIQVGDEVMDGSVSGRLKELARALKGQQ